MKPVALDAHVAVKPASAYRTASRQQTSIFIIGIRRAAGKKNDGMRSNPEAVILLRTLIILFAGILPALVLWDLLYVFTTDLGFARAAALGFSIYWARTVANSFHDSLDKIPQDIQK